MNKEEDKNVIKNFNECFVAQDEILPTKIFSPLSLSKQHERTSQDGHRHCFHNRTRKMEGKHKHLL